jgi:hypothetical protein
MEDICPFWRKTCFAGCNPKFHEGCSMKETNASVAKAQDIISNSVFNSNRDSINTQFRM